MIEKFNSKIIAESLKSFITQPRWKLLNLYVFDWESDLLFLTKSDYFYEFEIKVSRADFKNDFKKVNKHEVLKDSNNHRKPNYFIYAVPEGLIRVEEVPEYAGLYYIMKNGYYKRIKDAPQLHKTKVDLNSLNLLDKFYFNMINAFAKRDRIKYEYESYCQFHNKSDLDEKIKLERKSATNDILQKVQYKLMKKCVNYTGVENNKCTLTGSRCSGNCEYLDDLLLDLYN
jgi:hypothetical protein